MFVISSQLLTVYEILTQRRLLLQNIANNGGAPLPGIFPVGLISGVYLHIAPMTSWIDTTTGKAVQTTTLVVIVLIATATAATTVAVRKCRKSYV